MYNDIWASLVAQTVKNLPAMQETCVQSLGWEDPLEKGMLTHSSTTAWRIPWAEGNSPWVRKESDMAKHLTHTHIMTYVYHFGIILNSFPALKISVLPTHPIFTQYSGVRGHHSSSH